MRLHYNFICTALVRNGFVQGQFFCKEKSDDTEVPSEQIVNMTYQKFTSVS